MVKIILLILLFVAIVIDLTVIFGACKQIKKVDETIKDLEQEEWINKYNKK